MSPPYRISGEEGIFMRYSYEYKKVLFEKKTNAGLNAFVFPASKMVC